MPGRHRPTDWLLTLLSHAAAIPGRRLPERSRWRRPKLDFGVDVERRLALRESGSHFVSHRHHRFARLTFGVTREVAMKSVIGLTVMAKPRDQEPMSR